LFRKNQKGPGGGKGGYPNKGVGKDLPESIFEIAERRGGWGITQRKKDSGQGGWVQELYEVHRKSVNERKGLKNRTAERDRGRGWVRLSHRQKEKQVKK